MMKIVLSAIACIPFVVYGQSQRKSIETDTGKGIHFVNKLTWQQVLKKARAEKKYIFLDCYTTWCGPCKRMEKEVYPVEQVGSFFNKHFIAVKLQMDKTNLDDELVKGWYAVADSIKEKYAVDAFPTYLFLAPDGKPVHRAAGAVSTEKFLSFGAEALDPGKQSYTLEAKFAAGATYDLQKMSPAELKQMAVKLKNSNPELAQKMALLYIKQLKDKSAFENNYGFIGQFSKNEKVYKIVDSFINSLSTAEMYHFFTEEYFNFIHLFISNPASKAFKFFYDHTSEIDLVMNKDNDYKEWNAWMYISEIIYAEEMAPLIKNATAMPDWTQCYEKINNKYNEYYAEMIVLAGKKKWSAKQKDWTEYTKNLVLYVDKFCDDLQNSWYLNNYAWQVFQYSRDVDELKKALSWSERAIMYAPVADWMDTYSNLMYKLGKKKAAIHWQGVAATLDPKNEDIKQNLEKMNRGEPTWKEY